MKLPNGDKAVVDVAKLRDYCLNPDHYRGRHKSKVFATALGLSSRNAEELREALLEAARNEQTTETDVDEYGQRYRIDFIINRPAGTAKIRSGWFIRVGESFPRLTTCFVVTDEGGGE